MTTLGELQSYVRSTVDVTTADLPDAVLNVWLQDGFNRVLAMEDRWPFYEQTATFTAIVGTRAYPISAINPSSPFRNISAVYDSGAFGSGLGLMMVNHDEAQSRWLGAVDSSSQPLYYSKRGGSIHLWPKPNQAYQYTVLGYRAPTNWILLGTGASPDCDDRLHLPLADWALSRYFKQQEDTEMSALYEQAFRDGAALAHDAIMRADQETPLILGRGFASPTYTWWLQSLGRNLGH